MASLRETALRKIVGSDPFPQPPLVKTRYPVVLMHGFGMLAGLRRGGHLHEEAMNLRLHGVWAYAPNVASYVNVPVRAEMWEHRLEHILEETGAARLNLIAQSMGGLDARYLITKKGFHDRVASLTTISTPHRGTCLADIILEQPERLRNWAADLANLASETALDDATGDVLRAVEELTPAYVCDTFNPDVPDHPDVTYWSYAGAAGKNTDTPINPLMRLFNAWIFKREGLNDGFVPVESAKWGEFIEVIPADHSDQVGIHIHPGSSFKANAFYVALVQRLADAGF